MKAITQLAAVALGAMSIAAGVAVAQANAGTESTMNPDTANYGTPPGAPLKRDGSLSASGVATGTVTDNTSSTSSTTTTTSSSSMPASNESSTTTTTTSSMPSDDKSASERPRADRN